MCHPLGVLSSLVTLASERRQLWGRSSKSFLQPALCCVIRQSPGRTGAPADGLDGPGEGRLSRRARCQLPLAGLRDSVLLCEAPVAIPMLGSSHFMYYLHSAHHSFSDTQLMCSQKRLKCVSGMVL